VNYRDEIFLKDFGANLKKVRKQQGYTQLRLANELDFSQSHIANIELGKTDTSICHAAAFARLFKIPVSRLFEF
jgi:transcriptional regulator with XRE-family HTH domain